MTSPLRVELKETPSGAPTLLVNGRYFHSPRDPRKEADRKAAELSGAETLVLLSPGLGYLARSVKARRVLMIERNEEIAAAVGERWVNPTPHEVGEAIRSLENPGRVTIVTGVILDEDREYYDSVRSAVIAAIEKLAEEEMTRIAFGKAWVRNLEDNRPRFASAHWVRELAERFTRGEVIVLSAGPSLEDDLPALRERGRQLIIATDSALPATLAAGVIPDFCITVDPQPVKALSLRGLGEIPLIASVLSPGTALSRARTIYFFGQGHPMEQYLGIPPASVFRDIGGSVATAAATIAVALGARTIVLVGQDLAYLGSRTHVRGTSRENIESLSRFMTFETATHSVVRGNIRLADSVDGGKVPTTPVMESYRRSFEALAASNKGVRFIQTSPRGAKIDIERMTLKDYLQVSMRTGR